MGYTWPSSGYTSGPWKVLCKATCGQPRGKEALSRHVGKSDTYYCSHLTAGKCPCSKEIEKAQHSTKRESDEKDSAQLPRNELLMPSCE
jgi:hypothetical protein